MLHGPAPVHHPTHFGGQEHPKAPHIFCKQLVGRKQAELCSRPGPCMGSQTGRTGQRPGPAGANHWGTGLSACGLPGQKAVVARKEGRGYTSGWSQDHYSGDGNGAARGEREKKREEKDAMSKKMEWVSCSRGSRSQSCGERKREGQQTSSHLRWALPGQGEAEKAPGAESWHSRLQRLGHPPEAGGTGTATGPGPCPPALGRVPRQHRGWWGAGVHGRGRGASGG